MAQSARVNPNSTEGPRTDRRPRVAAAVYFAVQGASFAALVTRIPALQSKFDLSDGALAAILAVVPVVAGVGSVLAGHLVPKYGSANVLRVAGPVVPLSLVAVGAAASLPALLSVLIAVGLGLGAVDACMNMQGVGVQAAYGRSLMGSFHATWSLASIVGALAAAAAAAADLTLWAFFGILAVLFVPFQLAAGPSLLKTREANDAGPDIATRSVPWRPILLIGALVTCVYVIDSSAS